MACARGWMRSVHRASRSVASVLLLSACATQVRSDRPHTSAETLQLMVRDVCLPYVVDGLQRSSVDHRVQLHYIPELPSIFSSPQPGRGYHSALPGLPSLRLVDDGPRACFLQMQGNRRELIDSLRRALSERPGLLQGQLEYDRVSPAYADLCSEGGSPIMVRVSSSRYAGFHVAIQRAWRRSPGCDGVDTLQ